MGDAMSFSQFMNLRFGENWSPDDVSPAEYQQAYDDWKRGRNP
jgi:hypothetical protein